MSQTVPGHPTALDPPWEPARWGACWTRRSADPPAALLVVTGELDGATAPLLRRAWDAEVAALSGPVHVDLGRVSFCNAAGLHAVATILATCGERGCALTLSVQPRLAWLMRLVGMSVDGDADLVVVPRPGRPRAEDAVPDGDC